eukprot:TRINITY_DN16776_c0_g2_i1.p1 TRINITY_DN16776_c0_g2~~TRINITY_DN16776_c0_g2_i1.p1  ORF type:complete len:743 (+),score=127.44 TRINITY_DN16776_c0_g2_i1:66-2294(+)
MRVRYLLTQLTEEGLVQVKQLEALRGCKLGIHAIHWFRNIQGLKDPLAIALGGVPPNMFGIVDKELELFKKYEITPVFVFQGMTPAAQHSMFVNRMEEHMASAWSYSAMGRNAEAQKLFAACTSRVNSDVSLFIFHHLKQKGCEVVQAPYFAVPQLAHFFQQGIVDAAYGPPALLLYSAPRVVNHLEWEAGTFELLDMDQILSTWNIAFSQFVCACILAGNEFCLTYPYCNFQGSKFKFDTVLHLVRQAPLSGWLSAFPSEDMKEAHVEGYAVCQVLLQNSPVLDVRDNCVKPTGSIDTVPSDFNKIVGDQLPQSLYCLIMQGVLAPKLPQALASGIWHGSQPHVDTLEYRTLMIDLADYRQNALGLIARHLPPHFMNKRIIFQGFWRKPDTLQQRMNMQQQVGCTRPIKPAQHQQDSALNWIISAEAVAAELARQGASKVDLKFCLAWHAQEFHTDGPLIRNLMKKSTVDKNTVANDTQALSATVHFMLLENLKLIEDDGGMTVLGLLLKNCPSHFQEATLLALELMKFGLLSGEPLATAGEPFPELVNYPTAPTDIETRSVLLLSRVMSLVPMKLKAGTWNAPVDFDLAAFHGLVKLVMRALRQLTEASLASVLLQDMSRLKLLPLGFLKSTPIHDPLYPHPEDNSSLLPSFMLPRACMGIVCLHFLRYRGEPKKFKQNLGNRFPCCARPLQDLKLAFSFWEELTRCVLKIAEPLGAEELAEDMMAASKVLTQQRQMMMV